MLNQLAQQDHLPRIRLVGQCTLDLLAPQLALQGARRGRLWHVSCAGYDVVLPDLTRNPSELCILIPWSSRYLEHRDIDAEMVLWRTAWETLRSRGTRWVQVNYDWTSAGPLGQLGSRDPRGEVRAIEELNEQIRQELPAEAFLFDLKLVSGEIGRAHFYDRRNFHWFKQPFSEGGLELLASHLAGSVDALLGGARKVLVTDLDNTLWGGEVGEVGPHGIDLQSAEGEAFLDIQLYLKELRDRGVLLAACSKNTEENALAPFRENPDMRLREVDFSAFVANWAPKSENIKAIAKVLNLSPDALVFVDDNLRECQEVARACPEVAVIHLEQPSSFRNLLEEGHHFETLGLTREDAQRTASYRADAARKQAEPQNCDPSEYLRFLEMKASIETISQDTMLRAVQLLGKTNQFNLTTRRHGAERIQSFLATPGAYVKVLSLLDRFGDLGLISVLIALPDDSGRLIIDSWVLSCRAFERTVEQRFFNDLLSFAREERKEIWGEYQPTEKNGVVKELLPRLGFQKAQDRGQGSLYRLDPMTCAIAQTWIA